MKTSIRQIFSTNISQALRNANAPTAVNPFLTLADATVGSVRSETTWPVDSQAIRIGITAVGTINTLSYPVDATVVAGKTRRIKLLIDYSKTVGVSTTQWSFVIGGTTLTCVSSAMGNAVITNQMYEIDIMISYKSTGVNNADMVVILKRHDSVTGTPLEQLLASATTGSVVGTWNLALANTVLTRYQTISGVPTHTLTIVSVTSELL